MQPLPFNPPPVFAGQINGRLFGQLILILNKQTRMKRYFYFTTLIISLIVASCDKENERITDNNLIIGNWQLEEVKKNGLVVPRCDDRFTFQTDSVVISRNDIGGLAPACNMGIVIGSGGGDRGYWRISGQRLIFFDIMRNQLWDPPIITLDNQLLVIGYDNSNTLKYKRY